MNIRVLATPGQVDPDALRGANAVVVDVLRATSTICTAMINGCREIIPVAEVQEAFALAEVYPRSSVLLGGERGGRKVEGFDLGNSPREYKPGVVNGKIVIFTTTNGTRALVACHGAHKVFVLSLLNMRSVLNALANSRKDLFIVCAGQAGEFSLEDTVCAGMLAEKLANAAPGRVSLAEDAQQAVALARQHKRDFLAMLHASSHGIYLTDAGYAEDLEVCARINALDIVPYYRDGAIQVL